MDLMDLITFNEELKDIVESIEWLIATTDCDDYIGKCTIERIKNSPYWLDNV